jgi:tripartite-type tricarboxylate transporter receptor subunit TctC
MAKSEDDRKALQLILAPTKMGRPYIAPPGLPADRIATLRTAFAETMKDPAFLVDAKKLEFEINPTTGDELSAIVKQIYATPKAIVARAAQARK